MRDYELTREAFFLYYPSRTQLPPKLRAFIDWFRDANTAPPPRAGGAARSSRASGTKEE